MTTITIPKNLIKDDFVIVPRKEYEMVLRLAKKRAITGLDQELDKIIEEVRKGKVIGPFSSVKSLIKSLEQ